MQSPKLSQDAFSRPEQAEISEPLSVITPILDDLIDRPLDRPKDQRNSFDISYN